MYVLGINLSHDRSTALVKDGRVIVAIAEERLDRIKHSLGRLYWMKDKLGPKVLPWLGITYCLQTAGLSIDDLDMIVVDHAYVPVDVSTLRGLFPIRDPGKVQAIPHPSHHMAHACSAYFCSAFDESAILIIDHIGSLVSLHEKEGVSLFHAKGCNISLVRRQTTRGRDFEEGADSPASFYRIISLLLGFVSPQIDLGQSGAWLSQYDEAGKTMGLAPYGGPRKGWEDWVGRDEHGMPSYIRLIPWLEYHGLVEATLDKRDGVRMPRLMARAPEQPITKLHKDLAYKAQAELERALIMLADHLYKKTGCENLCMAGGTALNSVSNYHILKQGKFKNIFIQPAATDDGNAIGAAMYGYFKIAGGMERHAMSHAYLGRTYADDEIGAALKRLSIHRVERPDRKGLLEFVAGEIARGKVVAWMDGGSEFGPRALGNRSILADARNPGMKDHLNAKVKFRESFRPYAPVVLAEQASRYFDIGCESPFMLLIAPVRPEYRKELPAITHVDGTARLQTVRRDDNPLFYDLISEFCRRTGVPIILNTSFNIKGYPIVETPSDAIWSFMNAEIDYLVMGPYLVRRELYSDEDLMRYHAVCPFKIGKDRSRPAKHFFYDFQRQEMVVLSRSDGELLGRCDGSSTIEQIVLGRNGKQRETLERFREFLRNQWIALLPES